LNGIAPRTEAAAVTLSINISYYSVIDDEPRTELVGGLRDPLGSSVLEPRVLPVPSLLGYPNRSLP